MWAPEVPANETRQRLLPSCAPSNRWGQVLTAWVEKPLTLTLAGTDFGESRCATGERPMWSMPHRFDSRQKRFRTFQLPVLDHSYRLVSHHAATAMPKHVALALRSGPF